jgi:hypothetical protein
VGKIKSFVYLNFIYSSLVPSHPTMAPLKTLAAFLRAMSPAWAKQVHFDLDLTWQNGAPDGNMREMNFMNDPFPGPELRLDQGDGDEVEVSF